MIRFHSSFATMDDVRLYVSCPRLHEWMEMLPLHPPVWHLAGDLRRSLFLIPFVEIQVLRSAMWTCIVYLGFFVARHRGRLYDARGFRKAANVALRSSLACMRPAVDLLAWR